MVCTKGHSQSLVTSMPNLVRSKPVMSTSDPAATRGYRVLCWVSRRSAASVMKYRNAGVRAQGWPNRTET